MAVSAAITGIGSDNRSWELPVSVAITDIVSSLCGLHTHVQTDGHMPEIL